MFAFVTYFADKIRCLNYNMYLLNAVKTCQPAKVGLFTSFRTKKMVSCVNFDS